MTIMSQIIARQLVSCKTYISLRLYLKHLFKATGTLQQTANKSKKIIQDCSVAITAYAAT